MKALFKIFLLLFIISGPVLHAQQQIMFSQYMFNGLAINPAYAGSQESLSLTAMMRQQWLGLEGAPSTQTFSAHVPIDKFRIGVGLLVVHDNIGVTDQTNVNMAYSYNVPIGFGKLSLGLQGGFYKYKSELSHVSANDPVFLSGDIMEYFPNFGFGIFYYSERMYAGISAPQFLQSKLGKTHSLSGAAIYRHYFFQSGYVCDLGPLFKLKPNMLFKMVEGAPVEVDLNINVYYNDLLAAGFSWRSFDAVVAIFQVQISKKLQVGYSYDFGTTALRQFNSGSHEIYLNYRIPVSKSKIITPRYF